MACLALHDRCSGFRQVACTVIGRQTCAWALIDTVFTQTVALNIDTAVTVDLLSAWGNSSFGTSSVVANVTFQMLLLSDADLGQFHDPPLCDESRAGTAAQRDCVMAGCSSTSCDYYLGLTQASGSSQAHTLQVCCISKSS